jgi:hypothetical protein
MRDPPAAAEEEESRREKRGVPEAARDRMRVLQFERVGTGVRTDSRGGGKALKMVGEKTKVSKERREKRTQRPAQLRRALQRSRSSATPSARRRPTPVPSTTRATLHASSPSPRSHLFRSASQNASPSDPHSMPSGSSIAHSPPLQSSTVLRRWAPTRKRAPVSRSRLLRCLRRRKSEYGVTSGKTVWRRTRRRRRRTGARSWLMRREEYGRREGRGR